MTNQTEPEIKYLSDLQNHLQAYYKDLLIYIRCDAISIKRNCLELYTPSKWETHDAHDTRIYRFVPAAKNKWILVQKLVAGKARDKIEYTSEPMDLTELLKEEFGATPSTTKSRPKQNYRR